MSETASRTSADKEPLPADVDMEEADAGAGFADSAAPDGEKESTCAAGASASSQTETGGVDDVSTPEEAPPRHVVFGIDFGTEKCVLARFQSKESYPKIVLNKLANHHTPNVLSFQFDRRRIGEEAASGVTRPKITVNTVQKLFLGRSFEDPAVQSELSAGLLSAKIVNQDGSVGVEVNHCGDTVVLLPEQVAAGMFAQLKRTATWHTTQEGGLDHVGTVVAVPGCFIPLQRRAVLDACQIAGVKVLSLVDEATAAAVCYLMQHHHELQKEEAKLVRERRAEKERLRREKLQEQEDEAMRKAEEEIEKEDPAAGSDEKGAPVVEKDKVDDGTSPESDSSAESAAPPTRTSSGASGSEGDSGDTEAEGDNSPLFSQQLAIVDVGHRYMSAAVVRVTYKTLDVLASVSSAELGAAMFDRALLEHVADQILEKHKVSVRERPINLQKLLRAAEKTKKVLSTLEKTFFEVENINDRDFRELVTRSDMENACADGLARLTAELESLVAAAGVSVADLVAVEVVGGGSRIPSVAAAISMAFGGTDVSRTLDSAHSVAEGAAVLAAVLAPQMSHELVLEGDAEAVAPSDEYLSSALLERGASVERDMREKDERAVRKEQVYNELEAYIFYKKGQLSEGTYDAVVSSEEKAAVMGLLNDAESSLDPDKELEALESELAELKSKVQEAAPGLHAHLLEIEEQKKAARIEAEEHLKTLNQDPKEKEPRTVQEKITAAVKRKHQGNVLYKEFDYTGAVSRYTQALEYLNNVWDVREADKGEIESIKLSCHLNIAACWFKADKFEEAVSNATKALAIDADNVKALFRRAQSNFERKAYHESREDLEKAFKLEPKNKEVRALLVKARREVARAKKKEKAMYGKMFG